MRWAVRNAWAGLRARPGRAALTGAGIAAAALVLGVALTVAVGLATGFDRAATQADLPSVVARFDEEDPRDVADRVRRLPNLAAHSFRYEVTRVELRAGANRLGEGVVHVVGGGRRGYAVVAGRDVGDAAGEVVIEQGLAREWDLGPGDTLDVGEAGPAEVVGVAVAPDNVAFPLARTARVYLSEAGLLQQFPEGSRFPANLVLLWAADEERADVLLSFARQSAYGLSSVRFLTREGLRSLVEQASGIVVALLVAFAIIACALAGVLLAAGAHSEIQRRLAQLGVQRALGVTPGAVTAVAAAQGALVAAPAAAAGLLVGGLLAAGGTDAVLAALNELPPGPGARATVLAGAWGGVVALVAGSAAWPAWRAARRPPAGLLRGGDVSPPRKAARGRGGMTALGARLVTAHRARYAAVVAVLGMAAAVVLLLLALASLLERLRDDPATLGKRYSLTAALPADRADEVRALPGVAAAAPRYEQRATGASALGSPLRVIAYPGDHTIFEAPALAAGRRLAGPGEAEVGQGLADALGLRPGSTLAIQPGDGEELRFRVVGVVRALQDEGRVAYVRPDRLLAASPSLEAPLAVRLDDGADAAAVRAALARLGAEPRAVGGATGDDRGFLAVLAGLLRLVAVTVGLVCLYALVQSLALTVRERRGAVAVLRAAGADHRALRRLLFGAATAVVIPAAVVAVALEEVVLAPATARLAAGYADLPLGAGLGQAVAVSGALLGLAALASWEMARRLAREPVVTGLRETGR
ncbi:MAG: ABC transporter permease [Solirubrobacteraceae bacterium]|nr:ABC transporter permease [Solirubrobacteraceae bacterium]